MKFFAIDQHISVVADMKNLFEPQEHVFDDICLSGHAAIMGRKNEIDSVPYLGHENWSGFIGRRDWTRFKNEFNERVRDVDAFVVCYPPAFVYLYQEFDKPVIMNIPIRFDYCMNHDIDVFNHYVDFIRNGVDRGKIILVANSLFDKHYTENWVQREVEHIPSWCGYTGMRYDVDKVEYPDTYLYSTHYPRNNMPLEKHIVCKNYALNFGYPWDALTLVSGMIHFPYNISIMSIFEQYTAGIPLFFPSKKFILELYEQNLDFIDRITTEHKAGRQLDYEGRVIILDQVSWNFVFNREPKSICSGQLKIDPNNYKSMDTIKWWVDHADYYDTTWMPYIQYFDSFEELNEVTKRLTSEQLNDISNKMCAYNPIRKTQILRRWDGVLERAKEYACSV